MATLIPPLLRTPCPDSSGRLQLPSGDWVVALVAQAGAVTRLSYSPLDFLGRSGLRLCATRYSATRGMHVSARD